MATSPKNGSGSEEGPKRRSKVISLDLEVESEAAHLRRLLRDQRTETEKLKEILGKRRELYDKITSSVVAAGPLKAVSYRKSKGSRVTPVLMLSDWHIGEVVDPTQTEAFGSYNWKIARNGMLRLVEDFLQYVDLQRSGYDIQDAHILCLGDFVSGDIHDELKITNEFPLPVQAAKAGHLLAECLASIAPHFKHAIVSRVKADNHGRLVKKPQAKQKSTNNMNVLVYEVSDGICRQHKNIVYRDTNGSKLITDINGHPFLIMHGDGIRSQMGIPYYGFNRMMGKEAIRRLRTALGYEYVAIGHFHVDSLIEGRMLVNRSLSGTSEYDHEAGRFAYPGQLAFMVNHRHGLFNITPFRRKT